ncbi:unnamed protein product [Effrenium voratum]|nr:unnamed protein product [Effrenium voratum]
MESQEDGGVVDDMMQWVRPWSNDEEKMLQFMEETVAPSGELRCKLCQHVGSSKRLMLAHFEKKHQYDCEEWAKETIKGMTKASHESFMKRLAAIGDSTGEFVIPDGSKADMSKAEVDLLNETVQSVLPWSNDEEKMLQFMEGTAAPSGELRCKLCQNVGSSQRLMLAHFEKKHQYDCEEWAKETLKGMTLGLKASHESFMKRLAGIGEWNL